MKPFNLQEALSGAPICTRSGRDARIVCSDAKVKDFPILALVKEIDSSDNKPMEIVVLLTEKGTHYNDGRKNSYDLFMKEVERTFYVNIYKDEEEDYYCGGLFPSKEKAEEEREGTNNYITTETITFKD